MCAPASNSYRIWKGVFFAAGAIALLGCLYDTIGALCYNYYSSHHIMWRSGHISVRIIEFGEPLLRPMLWSFIAAECALLIVSPCFMWSALRSTAVKAWVVGLLALVYVIFCVSWH